MDSPEHDFVVLSEYDVKGTDASGLQPLSLNHIQEIHAWLKPTDYAAESSEYKRHLTSHVRNTDVWMQERSFQSWLQDQAHGSLWLKAIPGVGKSVVAARLVDYIQKELKAPVMFFFFRQIVVSNRTPSNLLCDWLAQILPHSPYLQTKLRTHLDDGRDFKSFSFHDLWSELTKALCALPKVYCVVDALDEMSHGYDDFCADLVALGELKPSTLKVCITSRPVPRIEKILRADSVQKLTLEPTRLQPAVAKYIDFRLERLQLPADVVATVQRQLLQRSTGLFLYVKLMMDELFDAPTLDVETIHTKVDQLPNGLAAMYSHMLHIHSIRSGIPQSLQIAILRWVTHSSRPLRVLELAAIIDSLMTNHHLEDIGEIRASYPNTKAMIKVACGPLVVILEDETVGIIHHSLTEYIVDSSRNDSTVIEHADSFPTIDSASSHKEMALTCLRYLCNGWADAFYVTNENKGSGRPSIESMYAKYPFLRYASDHWAHHARYVDHKDTDVFYALDTFVDPESRALEAWLSRNPAPFYHLEKTKPAKDSIIHLAARQGLASYIDYLVEKDHGVNIVDSSDDTPLHLAAQEGHSSAVFALIKHGAKPDQDNSCGLKPLHCAASRDHSNVVRVLLQAGVNPMTQKTKEYPGRRCGNAPRTTGDTPVKYAFHYGHMKAALTLAPYLERNELLSAVHWAAEGGRSEIVLSILDVYDVDINQRVKGKTLGYLAAYNHDIEVLERLQSLAADLDILCNGVFDEQGMRCIGPEDDLAFTALHAFARGCQKGSSGNARAHERSGRVLKVLLQSGCDINIRDNAGNGLLHLAMGGSRWDKAVDVKMIEVFLEHGADPCATNDGGLQPLHTIQITGPVVHALVKHGAKVNARIENSGKTPLHCCFESYQNEQLQSLLEYGADCNAQDNDGNTPLHMALRESTSTDASKIQILLDHGADPKVTNKKLETPLHVMRKGQKLGNMLPMLLEAGADVEARTIEGKTVLMTVASDWMNYHRLESLAPLLTAGANLDARDHDGRTLSLQLCSKEDSAEALAWLAEKGADLQVTDYSGNNAFHYLARQTQSYSEEKQQRLFDTICKHGVDPSATNHLGQLPLHIAAGTRQESYHRSGVDAVEFLLSLNCGADINAIDHFGLRPIHYAATMSSSRVRGLLEKGADACGTSFDGQTILHIACRAREGNTIGMISELFQSNNPSLIDHVDQDGRTALHYACRSGKIENVKILLNAGADPNVSDKKDLTPLDACAEFAVECRLWSPEPTRDTKRRFTDAAGMCLDDVQRPPKQAARHNGYSTFPALRISSEDDALGIRPIIRALLAHGADMSGARPVVKYRGFFGENSYSSREKHFNHAVYMRCDILVDELINFVNNETDEGEDSKEKTMTAGVAIEQKYMEYWMTLKYERSHDFIDNIVKDRGNQRDNYSKEKDVALFERILINEDERGIMRFCDLGGDLFGLKTSPIGVLTTLARYGYAETLSLLGPKGSQPAQDSATTIAELGLLHTACGRDLPNLDVLKVLVLQYNHDVDAVDKGTYAKEQSCLHLLASSSLWWKSHGIAFLAKHGADVNLKDKDGQTPLYCAIQSKATKNIQTLLSCGADPNIVSNQGTTCLNIAESSEIVDLLLGHEASPTIGPYPFLFDALNSMDHQLVMRIVQMGVDLNVSVPYEQGFARYNKPQLYLGTLLNKEGDLVYPIHFAASHAFKSADKRSKMAPIIELLLQYGANPLLECSPGQSILHALCKNGGHIEPFLDKFDTETRNCQGNTLLLSACLQEAGSLIINLLLERGANILASNNENQNVLHLLCRGNSNGFGDSLTFFLSSDSIATLINQADTTGKTPLIVAVQNRHLFATSILLNAGADPSATDNEGNNVLHHIAPYLFRVSECTYGPTPDSQTPKTFQTFLELGISINARNKYGQTPLHMACARGSVTASMLQFFIDNGADLRAVDGEGRNVLHLMASIPQENDRLEFDERRKARMEEQDKVWQLLTGNESVARLDPSDEDWSQRSVWDLASASGNKDVLARVRNVV